MVLNVRADRALIRAEASSRRFVEVDLLAPEAPARGERLPVNLAFVVDRSGSMDGEKIARAREAVLAGIRGLRSGDRFAVVAYDNEVDTVAPSTPATPEARSAAARAVEGIHARNSTDLCAGWRRGCDEVSTALDERSLGRCLLLTDGLANAGVTDVEELVTLASAARSRGVSTSTFGIGADFDEVLLRRMSEAGGGNFQYVETAAQIPDFIASEVGEALEITAREAVLVVEAGPGVSVESLNGFECRRDGEAWRVELGSLFSAQLLQAALRLTLPPGTAGEGRTVRVRVEDREQALGRAEGAVTFTWAGLPENDGQPRDRGVVELVAQLYAAAAEREALERNRDGDYPGARRVLERCIRQVEAFAGDDLELRGVVADLRDKLGQYAQRMDARSRKLAYSGAHSSLKGRLVEARRRRPLPQQGPVLLPVSSLLDPVRLAASHLDAAEAGLFGGMVVDDWLDGHGRGFDRFDVAAEPVLRPDAERRLLAECARCAPNAALRIAFTRQRLGDNWFSHWHEPERTAIVSLDGWDGGFGVPLEAFLAYEIALHGLRGLGPAWLPERLMHEETRGCLFDFCAARLDVVRKLQAASLCRPCLDVLRRGGVPIDRVQRVADAIRALAVPAGVVH
jgi:Ca-activated chloride channel homolog